MTLEAIKQAVIELLENEQDSLLVWLDERAAKAWDEQMERDFSEGGPGMHLIEEWDAEIKADESVPLEEFLAQSPSARKAK